MSIVISAKNVFNVYTNLGILQSERLMAYDG